MNDDILIKLKQLKIEDYIWIIVIGVSFFNLYSNYLEKKYIVTNNIIFLSSFRKINLAILIITLIITIYFTALSYENYQKEEKKEEFLLPLISNIMFLIGGVILIFAFFKNKNSDESDSFI